MASGPDPLFPLAKATTIPSGSAIAILMALVQLLVAAAVLQPRRPFCLGPTGGARG